MLELGHILFDGRFLGERPGQHELAFKDRPGLLDDAVEGGHHPEDGGMPDPLLDVTDAVARVALIPGAVEPLSRGPKLGPQDCQRGPRAQLHRASRAKGAAEQLHRYP